MHKRALFLLFIFTMAILRSQELIKPPTDLRSHNLTKISSSILNPAFSLEDKEVQSLSFWSRWQWQTIDTDPTTLFVNYNRKLNESSAAGVSFFQNNTGLYLNIGALFNYSHVFNISAATSLAVGANIYVFGQDLADAVTTVPEVYVENGIITQVSPGMKLLVGSLGIGFAMENAFDYHFKLKEFNTQEYSKVYTGMVSYDVPLVIGKSNTTLRPSIYVRNVPEYETQFGFIGSLHSGKYWGQLGYNNYYGISFGGGATILKKISLGALVELESKVASKDPTLELIAAYSFGKLKNPKEKKEEDMAEEKKETEEKRVEVEKPKKNREEKTKKVKKKRPNRLSKEEQRKQKKEQKRIEEEQKEKALIDAKQVQEAEIAKKRDDFINRARQQDSITNSRPLKEELKIVEDKVEPESGEKYEEMKKVDGLEPGFYIIANVYKTKRYLILFMNDLKKKGLKPKSFLRKQNGLNYVYLAKYKTIEEARKVKKSNFNGKYHEHTWIFRIVD